MAQRPGHWDEMLYLSCTIFFNVYNLSADPHTVYFPVILSNEQLLKNMIIYILGFNINYNVFSCFIVKFTLNCISLL